MSTKIIKFKVQKGKAFTDLPLKTLRIYDHTEYVVSTKFDGNQIFIHKFDSHTRFFTSDWHEFKLPRIGKQLELITGNFILVAEMNYNGEGKLGERTVVQGKITTERVNFKKGLPCSLNEDLVKLKLFDILTVNKWAELSNLNSTYTSRLLQLEWLVKFLPIQAEVVKYTLMLGKDIKAYAKTLIDLGWEGVMAVEPNSVYETGKRVNHSIKIKFRPTADLMCIDTKLGEGKYSTMIGSLVLQDSKGRIVDVGSGLSDDLRCYHEDYFVGKIIEIEYEQLMATYQQPVFKHIREDKQESD